jgi:predicted nucleic acid-binding protein
VQVICNSAVLIALSRIGYLWLLKNLFNSIIIPQAVYDEVVIKGSGKPGANDVDEALWIKVAKVYDVDNVDKLTSIIHQGEAEAIQLAEEMGADLLILDDSSARQIAKFKGINVVGTLAILRQSKENELIPALKPVLDKLKSMGFRMGDEYTKILKSVGEL